MTWAKFKFLHQYGLALLLLLQFGGLTVVASPSLDEKDRFSATIIIKGQRVVVPLLRDHEDKAKFYYIPPKPFLETRMTKVGKETVELPVFNLLKYQLPDPQNAQKILEGGIMQFSVSLALPSDVTEPVDGGKAMSAIDQIKKVISENANIKIVGPEGPRTLAVEEIDVAPVPISSSQVNFYAPQGSPDAGGFLAAGGRQDGIAPVYVEQSMPYSVSLQRNGVDVFSALLTSQTGLPVVYTLEHEAITPPIGFEIEVHWEQIRSHFSSSSNYSYQKEWSGIFYAGKEEVNQSSANIINYLKSNKCVTIKVEGGEAMPAADLMKYAQPVLDKIYEEVFGKMPAPPAVDPATALPAKADSAAAAGWFGGSNSVSNLSSKRVEELMQTDARVNMTIQNHVKVKTVVGGFISVADYIQDRQAVQDALNNPKNASKVNDDKFNQMVTFVTAGQWDSAYFILPNVSVNKSMNIDQIDMEVRERDMKGEVAPGDIRYVKWSPKGTGIGSWTDKQGTDRQSIPFGLLGWRRSMGAKYNERLGFEIKTTVRTPDGDLVDTQTIPVFTGDTPVSSPLANIKAVTVRGNLLPFEKGEAKLLIAMVRLTSGDLVIEKEISKASPEATFLLAAPQGLEYSLDMKFICENSEVGEDGQFEWKNNGNTFRDKVVYPTVSDRISATGSVIKTAK